MIALASKSWGLRLTGDVPMPDPSAIPLGWIVYVWQPSNFVVYGSLKVKDSSINRTI